MAGIDPVMQKYMKMIQEQKEQGKVSLPTILIWKIPNTKIQTD